MFAHGNPYCDRCLNIVTDDVAHRWELDGTHYHLCWGCRARIVEMWLDDNKHDMLRQNHKINAPRARDLPEVWE